MPVRAEAADSGVSGPQGDPRARRDHESIARLADDVLPALIARLAASGLREIEVREGGWKARLRKPAPTGDPRRIAMVGVEAHAGSGYPPAEAPLPTADPTIETVIRAWKMRPRRSRA